MRHRIFIAINLPEDVKRNLLDCQNKWLELPCRWTKKENLHITLMFLGYLSDEELLEVLKITKEVASRNPAFSINLKKILYGPPHQNKFGAGQSPKKMPLRPPKFSEIETEEKEWEQKFGRPRMVWAEGEKSEELGKLQKDLENSLLSSIALAKEDLVNETKPYTLHITLARIKQWEFRQIEPEERPIVDEEISLSFEVNSIEVMESRLKPGGSEYTILESFKLKK